MGFQHQIWAFAVGNRAENCSVMPGQGEELGQREVSKKGTRWNGDTVQKPACLPEEGADGTPAPRPPQGRLHAGPSGLETPAPRWNSLTGGIDEQAFPGGLGPLAGLSRYSACWAT